MFGRRYNVVDWVRAQDGPALPPDPTKPDPRARSEMKAFDSLGPEARAAFRDASQQFSAAEVVDLITSRGATPALVEAARARGLLPYQLGRDGMVAVTVHQLDTKHTNDFNREKGLL